MKNTFLLFSFKKIIYLGLIFFTVDDYGQVTPLGFETVFYEGFDYPAGEDLYYQSGGNGFISTWKKSYQYKYLGVQSSGWTYPNLQTTGLRATFDNTCYGICNDISSSGRDVPSQASGVLYLQFLASFGTQLGGGTPHLRLYDDSGLKLVIGGNTAANWQLVDINSNTTVSTSRSLSILRLVVVRFDYDNAAMKMWIDPNLATFDYSNPPTPSAQIPNITPPSFNRLELYFRSNGTPGIDEIHAFRSLLPATFGTFAPITKQYFTRTHAIVPPTTNNTNPIVYSSDNLAVATVSGSVITFTGVGTANITASQAADANYEGNAISTVLTVLGKDLVSKYGGISNTDVNYISVNGSVGGAFGIDKYGKQEIILDDFISLGLVMHLDAGNTTSYPNSGTTWTDISGNGNHGTLQNGVTFNNTNDASLVFDGVNDFFVTNTNLDLSNTDKLTIQIIMRTAQTNLGIIMEHSVDWNINNAFGILHNNSSTKTQFTDHNNGSKQGYNISNSGVFINDNNWHLFSATTDRSLNASNQNLIYIDDNAANQTIFNSNYLNDNSGNFGSHKLYLSGRAGSAMFFNGSVAQVLIYNRVLTAAEIQQNFNAVKLKYGL